jgi:hypothetical protein
MGPLKPHIERIIEAEINKEKDERNISDGDPKRLAITNQRALLDTDPRRILTGEVEVYDDRESRRR